MSLITLERVYEIEGPIPKNTYLVDRLWPRGISKEKLEGVTWLKELAPSDELREQFHHHPDQWSEFKKQYLAELEGKQEWQPLVVDMTNGVEITLLYGSKDTQHNQAVVLQEFLLSKLEQVNG